jgi:hypothetical protein
MPPASQFRQSKLEAAGNLPQILKDNSAVPFYSAISSRCAILPAPELLPPQLGSIL